MGILLPFVRSVCDWPSTTIWIPEPSRSAIGKVASRRKGLIDTGDFTSEAGLTNLFPQI